MTITPVADDCGWYHYCFAVERDITERKRAQQALTDQNDALEVRVAQRTHELQQTVRDLEGFSQTIAHDLQNPLTSVRSFADLLLQDHAAVLPADATHMLRLMQRSTVHMQQIIRDLQALANINRMAARPVPTDLVALCRPLFTELQATDAQRSVQVVMPARIDVHADLQLLRVVFDSLLDNAWKYTSKTASACITLSAVSGPGGVVVTVADNGAGFDAAAAHRLFTPFHRLHRASQFNGTGIGLAAAARAVERMAGWVWADGRPDGGARFHVFLPSASQSGVDQLHAKRDCSDASASA